MSPEKQKGGRILRAGTHIESTVNLNSKPPDPQKLLSSFRELIGQDKPQDEPQEQIPALKWARIRSKRRRH